MLVGDHRDLRNESGGTGGRLDAEGFLDAKQRMLEIGFDDADAELERRVGRRNVFFLEERFGLRPPIRRGWHRCGGWRSAAPKNRRS